MVCHINQMGDKRITQKVYEAWTTKKNGRGRPRRTQNEEVRKVVEKRGEKMQQVLQMNKREDGNKCGKEFLRTIQLHQHLTAAKVGSKD